MSNPNANLNSEAYNAERIAIKRERQVKVINDLINQLKFADKEHPDLFKGVLKTLDEHGVSFSEYTSWLRDTEFQPLYTEYQTVLYTTLKDRFIAGLTTGKNAQLTAYILGALNKLHPEFKDSAQNPVQTIVLTNGIRQVDVDKGIGKIGTVASRQEQAN